MKYALFLVRSRLNDILNNQLPNFILKTYANIKFVQSPVIPRNFESEHLWHSMKLELILPKHIGFPSKYKCFSNIVKIVHWTLRIIDNLKLDEIPSNKEKEHYRTQNDRQWLPSFMELCKFVTNLILMEFYGTWNKNIFELQMTYGAY